MHLQKQIKNSKQIKKECNVDIGSEVEKLLKQEVCEIKLELQKLRDINLKLKSNYEKEIQDLLSKKQKIEKINLDINKGK